jgi:drug/metabolite transporter (DMT)-like permease
LNSGSKELGAVPDKTGGDFGVQVMPLLFVFFWSTGFIGAKVGLPYVEPLTFLLIRFAFVVLLMLPIALLWRASWPKDWRATMHIAVSGILLHAGYLGGVFAAIHAGMPAALASLIVGLQPVLTAIAAAFLLHERTSARQWTGLVLGLAGVGLVLERNLSAGGLSGFGVSLAVLSLLSITAGTVYQKRFCSHFDLRSGSVIQFVAAGLTLLPFAAAFETMQVKWAPELLAALAWLVVVLSIASISLLSLLIRRGAATRVASLFYLVPPATAVEAYLLFGERLSPGMILGMALAIAGVALVTARQGR